MTKEFNFESSMRELEEITSWFEGPDVNLDQSLAKFERGLELSKQLSEYLKSVENKVEKIKARFDSPIRNTQMNSMASSDEDATDRLA